MKLLYRSLIIIILLSYFSVFNLNTNVHTQAEITDVVNPGTYIYEMKSLPYLLDPALDELDSRGLHELVYETLISFNGNSGIDLMGRLALNWIVSSDGLQYRFFLRPDVYFHDGVHFNAYIMKYSIDRLIIMNSWNSLLTDLVAPFLPGAETYNSLEDQANVTHAINYLNAGAIEVINDFELVLNLVRPYAGFLYFLTEVAFSAVSPYTVIQNIPTAYTTDTSNVSFGMVPLSSWFPALDYRKLGLTISHPHGISGVVPYTQEGYPNQHTWMQENAIGTGPYELTSRNMTEKVILLDKYNSWWGPFSSQSVTHIIFRENYNDTSLLSNLEQGLVDQIQMYNKEFLDENNSLPFEGAQVYERPKFLFYFLQFNLNDSLPGMIAEDPSSTYNSVLWDRFHWGGVSSPDNPLTAHAFRLAFGLAFNYTNYLEVASNGLGERLEGLIPNGMFGHNDQLIEQGFIPEPDLVTAAVIFNQIGWRGNISLVFNEGNIIRENIYNSIKESIEGLDVGINISVEGKSFADWLPHYLARNFTIYHSGWGADTADPDLILASIVHSTRAYSLLNLGYGNSTVDSKIAIAAEEQDPVVREQLYHELEELIAREHYFIYGIQKHNAYIVKDWIQNVKSSGSLNPMSFMLNLEFIDKTDVIPTTTTTTVPITMTTDITTEPYIETTTDNTSLMTTTSTEEETQPVTTTTKENATLTSPSFMALNTILVLVIGSVLVIRRRK